MRLKAKESPVSSRASERNLMFQFIRIEMCRQNDKNKKR